MVKPGFVREPDFGRLVASLYYSDITAIEVRASTSNWAIKIHTLSHQVNENHAQSYQGNQVVQAKDLFLSNNPNSIPITRWALDKYRPHLYILAELVKEAKEA